MRKPQYLAAPRIQGSEQVDVGGRRYGVPPGAPRTAIRIGGVAVLYLLDQSTGRVHCLTGKGEAAMPVDVEAAALRFRIGVDPSAATAPKPHGGRVPTPPKRDQGPLGFPGLPPEHPSMIAARRRLLRKRGTS